MKNILFSILSGLMILSCVPPTKFRSLQTQAETIEQENENLRAENEKLSVQVRETQARLDALNGRIQKLGKDTVRWKNEITTLQNQLNQLSRDYSDLEEANQALTQGSSAEIRRLMDDLQETQKDIQAKENELNKLSADLANRQQELNGMQTELNSRNIRLAELEKILNDQQQQVSNLRRAVADALLGFENQGLTVSQRDGKVYVSLDEQLLFRSGSTVVDPKGVTALQNLAGVLANNPEINIMIEGHTDDVPIVAGSVYKDNWDLSVLRATAVVRILLQNSRIDPVRITTAGRSQYLPVDPARTAEARQKNRRTEIILSPRLDALYDLIN